MKKDKTLLYAGGFAGFLASLCCVGPIILIFFGLGSVSGALALGQYSPFFITLALIFFGTATVLYLKRKKCCNIKGIKQNYKMIIISLAILVIFLMLFKYLIAPVLATLVY